MSDGDLSIYQAIGEIINELGGIGKTGLNKDQGYNFRGIDAILVELHPLLAKYGVFFAPQVVERIYEERVSSKGNIGHCAHLRVTFYVYGPTGDSISVTTWGEGLDYSDKATNKAMTAAFKYALFQLFAICDPTEDADSEGHEGGSSREDEHPDPSNTGLLVTKLVNSGFTKAIQSDIVASAIGRRVRDLVELSAEEVDLAIRAIDGAVADREQLEEEE